MSDDAATHVSTNAFAFRILSPALVPNSDARNVENAPLSFPSLRAHTSAGKSLTPKFRAMPPLSSSCLAYANTAVLVLPFLNFTAADANQAGPDAPLADPNASPEVSKIARTADTSPWCKNPCACSYARRGAKGSSCECFSFALSSQKRTMLASSLDPEYVSGLYADPDPFARPARNALMVGKPETPCASHRLLCASQSTAASVAAVLLFFSARAAASYSGASFLQWPHQGA
mmetsp:Transcript_7548/g.32094  ORF Transcript_7548/g.32094 Transcript_7548/m.32094 type:complete len:232 (+) Transcript_7548:820-1515(+)